MTIWKSKRAQAALLLVGLGFLAYFISKLGWDNVADHLFKMKSEFILILLIASGWYLLNCLGWEQFLHDRKEKISLWQLFQIKIAGEAINSATPINWAGGDPLRVAMMRKFLSGSEGAASVVLDRTIHSLTAALVMASGISLALITLELPEVLRSGILGVLGGIIAILIIVMASQHQGLFTGLIMIADKLRLGRFISRAARTKCSTTDDQIRYFYVHGKTRFYLAIGFHALGRLLGILEIYAIAAFLDIPLSFLSAYFLAALSALVNTVFVIVPGSIGIMEGAYGGLFHLISLDPAAGIALQLVRRLRTFFWIGMGFFFIFLRQRHK